MMEFEDQHDADEDEDLDEEEEDEIEVPNSSFKMVTPTELNSPSSPPPLPLSLSFPTGKKPGRYRECQKNHAVTIGGHAVDGCGEFMPGGPEGSLDALKCAACNCHRNFHRKEDVISYFQQQQKQHQNQMFQFYPYGRSRPLALPSSELMISEPMSAMGLGTTSSSGKKRFRTKFTGEQKEKMMELAEKLEWRLQKQDEAVISEFCEETGVKRHVLKVWMHNNKHTLGKRTTPLLPPPPPPAPPL